MSGRCVVSAAVFAVVSQLAAAGLDVETAGAGFRVMRGGQVVVDAVRLSADGSGDATFKTSRDALGDGSTVWNRWCEETGRKVRLEVARHGNGEVEITMAGRAEFGSAAPTERRIVLEVPAAALDGRRWRALDDKLRGKFAIEGSFGEGFRETRMRWLAVDGVVFDFNPLGPGDYEANSTKDGWRHSDSIVGVWTVRRDGDRYLFEAGSGIKTAWGGFVGAKVVIREGEFDDYGKYHALNGFLYQSTMEPLRLLAFGSPRRGASYSNGEVVWSSARGHGWLESDMRRWPFVGHPEGAYYSHVGSCNDAVYRFSGLPDGWYFFTVAFGNYSGEDNSFRVTANGKPFLEDVSIPKGKLRTVTKLMRIREGTLDVGFSGNWIVSVMALQPFLSAAEDFNFTRRFWCVDGFEPGGFHRNRDIIGDVKPKDRDLLENLPVPGTEFAAPQKHGRLPVELSQGSTKGMEWTRDANIYRLFNNSSLLDELDGPGVIGRYFDQEIDGKGITAIMLSGMLSRHTYIGHERRGLGAVRRIVDEAHRRGIKVIDHIDVTLLWNVAQGFRVMAEHADELMLTCFDRLPSFQYCFQNPEVRKRLMAYLEEDVRNGVDALQLDEAHYWKERCTCPHCRRKFFEDTGWTMPMNEADVAWTDVDSPFRKCWHAWRIRTGTDFLIEVKRRLKAIRPDLVISEYQTEDGVMGPWDAIHVGRSYMDLGRVVDFFGMEVMSRTVLKNFRVELPNRRVQNMVAIAYGAPIWDWYYSANWQNDYAAWALGEMSAQSSLLSQVDIPPDAPDYLHFRAGGRAMQRVGATTVAEVALFYSSPSLIFGKSTRFAVELSGVAQALEALHVPYDVIADPSLDAETLGKYKVLVLGTAECLSDAQVDVVREYVSRGGRVRLSRGGGSRDERGRLRERNPLEDLVAGGRIAYSPVATAEPFAMSKLVVGRPCAYAADPAAERKFRSEVWQWAKEASWWRIAAPDGVYTAVWRERDGNLAIHFFNATGVKNVSGDVVTADAPSPAFPRLESDVSFVVQEGSRAWAVSPEFDGERELHVEKVDGNGLKVVVPGDLLRGYLLVRVGR